MESFDNEKLTEQVIKLTQRVYSLEKEVAELKSGKTTHVVPTVQPVVAKPTATTQVAAVTASPVVSTVKVPEVAPKAPVVTPAPIKKKAEPKPKKSVESNIGKNLMGVIASLLILLSFILFAVFAFPLVSDPIKLAILYAISLGFGAFGLIKMNKKSSFNALFMTFAGIGVSGFYVISLIGSLVFKVIPELALVALILLWLVATVLISKFKSRMFMYICNVGLIVSAFLMYVNWKEILVGLFMYYIGGVVLYFLNRTSKHSKDLYWIIQIPVMSLIYIGLYNSNPVAILIVAISVAAFFILQAFIYDIKGAQVATFVISQIFTLAAILLANMALSDTWDIGGAVIGAVIMLAVTLVGYFKFNGENKSIFIINVYGLAVSLLTLNQGFISDYVGVIVFAVPFIILGYMLKNNHVKYIGYVYYLIYLFDGSMEINAVAKLIIGLVTFAMFFAFMIINRPKDGKKGVASFVVDFYILVISSLLLNTGFISDYVGLIVFAIPFVVVGILINSKNMKYVGTLLYAIYVIWTASLTPEWISILISIAAFVVFVAFWVKNYSKFDKYILATLLNLILIKISLEYVLSEGFLYLMLAAVSVLFSTKLFRNSLVSKLEEKASVIISYIYNAILLVVGTLMILIPNLGELAIKENVLIPEVPALLIFIAVTLVLAIINISRLYRSEKHPVLYNIYTCIKLTILLLVILDRFNVVPMIISIIALVVAIGCIVLGFALKTKAFRIYGLVLTILFVFKLCLIDISYDSDIMRPIGFFVAGILCLAISWIYARLEKSFFVGTEGEAHEAIIGDATEKIEE